MEPKKSYSLKIIAHLYREIANNILTVNLLEIPRGFLVVL